jgi:hypothetical protein
MLLLRKTILNYQNIMHIYSNIQNGGFIPNGVDDVFFSRSCYLLLQKQIFFFYAEVNFMISFE